MRVLEQEETDSKLGVLKIRVAVIFSFGTLAVVAAEYPEAWKYVSAKWTLILRSAKLENSAIIEIVLRESRFFVHSDFV